MRYVPTAVAALLLLTVATTAAHAQQNEVTLEASVIRGAAGYARHVSPRSLVGIELGFGFPQIDRTLRPGGVNGEKPGFEEYLHLALFTRLKASPNAELDAGLRAGVADLWECTASDCWPAIFGGAYIQPMVGARRIKVGMRLTGGWIAESREGGPESSTFVVGLNPFIVRATLPW